MASTAFDLCCHRCADGQTVPGFDWLPVTACAMILCPECGNKRCPKATSHNLECTGSNKTGQPGSIFAAFEET